MDEAYETRFRGRYRCRYRRTPLISSARAQGATIKIGMCAPVTGPAAESGGYAIKGAKLALEAVNKAGGVLGKQAELIVEDDQTTNPGIVLAFSKLAAQSDIVGFLGSIRSTQVHAMAPDVLKLGKPVMIGGTDPNLTHMGNQWLFRFRPNDSYSGRVIADYGVNTLGKKKWAVLHSTDAFGTAGGKALSAALEKLGAPPVLDQGYANQSQDFTPVVLAIKQSGADILGSYFTFENDLGIFARQLRQLGVNIPWVGSPSIVNITALKLAGPALYNTYRRRRLRRRFQRGFEGVRQALSRCRQGRAGQPELLALRRHQRARGGDQQGRLDRPGQDPRGDPCHQEIPGRRGRIQFRPERRRASRLQHREERQGQHRLRQAHRVQRLIVLRPLRLDRGGRTLFVRSCLSHRTLVMDLVLQLLFTGIGIGAVYALVALGFVLIFRATNVVNFAQGEFSMVAAYLMVVFAVDLGWPYWLSFLIALAGMALLGVVFNLGVYYPLRHRTLSAGHHRHHRRLDPARQFRARDLRPAAAGAAGLVRNARHPARAGLSRQPVSPDHRRDGRARDLQLLVLREHAARQEAAGDLAGQGNGLAARHFRLHA